MEREERIETTGEEALRIERRDDGRVFLTRDGGAPVPVQVRRSFPWSSPDQFVSLCDDSDHELALIASLDELDAESRLALEEALAPSRFVLDVVGVREIELEFEIRRWEVDTVQGAYVFQTKHEEWPVAMDDGSMLIRDIEGNLFRIADAKEMDARSRKLLWAFLD